MNNQNISIATTSVNDIDNAAANERYKAMLAELLKTQGKVMEFIAKEGVTDTLEGESIAEGIGDAIKAFDGILPSEEFEEIICENTFI